MEDENYLFAANLIGRLKCFLEERQIREIANSIKKGIEEINQKTNYESHPWEAMDEFLFEHFAH